MRFLWIYTLFLPFTATAQYDAILADTSVSWAGIFEMTLPANPLNYSEEEFWQNLADLVVLKLQSDDTGLSGYFDYSFNTPMWKRLERLGKDTSIAIYVPNDLKKPASPGERDHIFRVQTDTVSIFNPTTYEEETTEVTAGYQPENIVDFQLTEEWIWDNKQQLPFVRLRAVAPRSRKTSSWHKTVFYLKTMY